MYHRLCCNLLVMKFQKENYRIQSSEKNIYIHNKIGERTKSETQKKLVSLKTILENN